MSTGGWIFLAVVAVFVIYAVMLYNGLVTVKHGVSRAWSNIDVLLKQRHDEIPKLVETCRQYRQFEQETLEKVIRARSGAAAEFPSPAGGRTAIPDREHRARTACAALRDLDVGAPRRFHRFGGRARLEPARAMSGMA